ncbi:hypothetical protein CYMTET_33049, partial [Cymbomonas tetramitiformis]
NITAQLGSCVAEPTTSVAQAQLFDQYFPPGDLYLCSRFKYWLQPGAFNSNITCDVMLYHARELDKRFNFAVGAQNITDLHFCYNTRQQASCTNGTTLRYVYTFVGNALPSSHQTQGCRRHVDCPAGYFCGMMKTGAASLTDSLCRPCAACEGCFSQDDLEGFDEWFLAPVEPTCGHCACGLECSPGCTAAEALNLECDAECFTAACNYDNSECPFPEGSGLSDLQTCSTSENQARPACVNQQGNLCSQGGQAVRPCFCDGSTMADCNAVTPTLMRVLRGNL